MKSLTEYALLKCGKSINEGLKIKKDSNIKTNELEFNIPKYDDGDLSNEIVGTVTLPRHKYFVYYDNYRELPHFATIDDMLFSIAQSWEGDYEDLAPSDVVIFSSDNYKECIEFIFDEYFGGVALPKKIDDIEEFVEKYDAKFYTHNGHIKVADDVEMLCNFYLGKNKVVALDDSFDVDDKNAVYKLMAEYC